MLKNYPHEFSGVKEFSLNFLVAFIIDIKHWMTFKRVLLFCFKNIALTLIYSKTSVVRPVCRPDLFNLINPVLITFFVRFKLIKATRAYMWLETEQQLFYFPLTSSLINGHDNVVVSFQKLLYLIAFVFPASSTSTDSFASLDWLATYSILK